MEQISINSGSVCSIGYDISSQILEVHLRDNRVLRFYEIPIEIFRELFTGYFNEDYFYTKIYDNYFHCFVY